MTFTIDGNLPVTDTSRRYVTKVIGSLGKYLPKSRRTQATAMVTLDRVDRIHGNKYEASVRLTVGDITYRETDSTLNVLAALDIVRLKLVRELEKAAR